MKADPIVYTFDFETDPFKYNREPRPFAVGCYCINTDVYEWYWGKDEDVIDFIISCMEAAPAGSIFYAHNGGRFDVHYLKSEIHGAVKVIGARVAECQIRDVTVRDSYAMLPVPLKKFGGKKDIEIEKLEPDVREFHKAEILEYMEADCRVLAKAISRFQAEFGLRLTMASAAMKQLQKFHEFEKLASQVTDELFRNFYYGGRVECMESGVIQGKFKTYDVNSMYPAVMRNFDHPVSSDFTTYQGPYAESILPRCDFAEVEAINRGCLPSVGDDGKLSFRRPSGIFFATGHEIRAGLDTGTIDIIKVRKAYKGSKHARFDTFVDHFYNARLIAKAEGDALLELFYKLVMNSSYGKFAQNPDRYKDWEFTTEIKDTAEGWVLEFEFPDHKTFIWSRPSQTPAHLMRFNVATAASVTGAARAQLWRGICGSVRPIYCDTDSLTCEDLPPAPGIVIDPKLLGGWKLEVEAEMIAIAGRKLYAQFDGAGKAVKQASKGVKVSAKEILKVARGQTVHYRNEAPTFSLNRPVRFVQRKVRKTV